jgi:hypothetical protein
MEITSFRQLRKISQICYASCLEKHSMDYRLTTEMVGMFKDERLITKLPIGAVLQIPVTDAEARIVEALYNGRFIRVFLHDLKERSVPIK